VTRSMPEHYGNVLSWASELEIEAAEQAARTARLPFLAGPLALMPDAHWGIGSTVGSVIPTMGAIIPAAVGVDIGCGMIATNTGYAADHLPDSLGRLHGAIRSAVPAGVGKGRNKDVPGQGRLPMPKALEAAPAFMYMKQDLRAVAANQLGSLGSGNHFVEVCLDENDEVWLVLHSGSRGVGNKLAKHHIDIARGLMKSWFINLEDPDLAYLVQGTSEFDAYITDMLWAQDYAMANRQAMMDVTLRALQDFIGEPVPDVVETVNCHHNFTQMEHHHGKDVWLTRKGAISARQDQRGVIPGSMGAATYIVKGLGNKASYFSCSHGAGRRMSRGRARRELTLESLDKMMDGKTWNDREGLALLDEHPDAYKPIDQVMEDQKDLVQITHSLHQVLNYKGV
jgi:tRNA-splicing ligase RtcB (3'-phosphate/5'-hydroxy nucleic acid ligase)